MSRIFQIQLFLLVLLLPGCLFALSLDPFAGNLCKSDRSYTLVFNLDTLEIQLLDQKGNEILEGTFKLDLIDGQVHLTLTYPGSLFAPEISIALGPVGPLDPEYRDIQIGDKFLVTERPRRSSEPGFFKSDGEGGWSAVDQDELPEEITNLYYFIRESMCLVTTVFKGSPKEPNQDLSLAREPVAERLNTDS